MPTFYGPETQTRSLVSPDPIEWARNPLGQALMRHYGTQAEGVNVYLLHSGVVTTEDPIDWDTVRKPLWGAHCEPVNATDIAMLTAAGWGAYVHDGEYVDIYTDTYCDFEGCCASDGITTATVTTSGFVDPFGDGF